jgi:ArsR family transcriptional regulator
MTSRYIESARVFKALSDENRLAILELLSEGEKCGCVLLEALKIRQPTLSHHMRILYEAGIVDRSRAGKWIHYSISEQGSKKLLELVNTYTKAADKKVPDPKCICE